MNGRDSVTKDDAPDPVGTLAEEFVERFRRGERPALTEYTSKHPELAERIRSVFPMLVMMEQAGPAEDASSGVISTQAAVPALRQVGDYRILRRIGRGGMGEVYEAEQLTLGRRVALKVLPMRDTKDGKALARFRREAGSAARLHHTNIVPVFEVGQDNEFCYYAMQLIQGQGLDEVILELARLKRQLQAGDSTTPREQGDDQLVPDPPPPMSSAAISLLSGAIRL